VAHIFAGKLTWQPAAESTVELSLFGDPSVRHAVADVFPGYVPSNSDPYLTRQETGGTAISLRASGPVSGLLRVEASIARSSGRDRSTAETERGEREPFLTDHFARVVEGGIGSTRLVDERRTAAVLKATLSAGRHTVVAGAEYEAAQVRHFFLRRLIERWEADEFVTWFDSTRGTFRSPVPTVYLQDAWRVADRLTLSAGLRWSQQRLLAASGGTAQRFTAEWQPRLGFNLKLGALEGERVFGSYGRFYQQVPLHLGTLWYADYIFVNSYYPKDPRQMGAIPDAVVDGSTFEGQWARSIPGLAAEHFDEFTLGYERVLAGSARARIRAIRRNLRSSFQMGVAGIAGDTVQWVLGTPGSGAFDFLPPARRSYTALELSLDGASGPFRYLASYVLSRTFGNYTGLYSSDNYSSDVGVNMGLLQPDQAENSTGLLPNDRTHVAKLAGAWKAPVGFTTGLVFSLQSGTPLNAFGEQFFGGHAFQVPRGSAGRTPVIWDLGLRLAYERTLGGRAPAFRVVLDLLQVGNPQRAVRMQQIKDAPDFLKPTAYQPPMTARAGLEISF
jgi:hypothetical protein